MGYSKVNMEEPQLKGAPSLQFKNGEAGKRPGDVLPTRGPGSGLRAGRKEGENLASRLPKQ